MKRRSTPRTGSATEFRPDPEKDRRAIEAFLARRSVTLLPPGVASGAHLPGPERLCFQTG